MKGNKKTNIIQTTMLLIYCTPKRSCTNKEYVEKGLTIYYIDLYWIKHFELQAKYPFNQMRLQRSQKNLCRAFVTQKVNDIIEQTPKIDS